MSNRSVLVCGLAALFVSCSGDKHGGFVPPDGPDDGGASATGNRPGAGGSSGRGGGGKGGAGNGAGSPSNAGQGGVAPTSAAAPVIRITAPVAANDPNVDTLLVEDQITVLCTAKKSTVAGAKPVDPSTVTIALLDADGKQLKSSAGSATDHDSEYSATFVLTAVPSGRVSFSCSADDTAVPANTGSASIDTLLDQGPEITIGEPADKSSHSLLGAMNVEFDVAPLPVALGDKQAAVSGVTLLVGGVKIETVEKSEGHYQASVNFNDKTLFNTPPSGVFPIVINASDSRKKPGKATRTLSYGILIDGAGPVIALGSPGVGAVIGPASVLTFNVTDAGSGVDRETVGVKLNDELKLFSATDNQWTWQDGSGAFSFKIGTALASKSDTQVTIAVIAKDKAGNSSTGDTRVYNLDNKPPIVDMDPPNVYEVRPGTADGTLQCSELFDPLGAFNSSTPLAGVNGSPDDMSTIVNFGRFRALVWDETNTKPGQGEVYLALTDKESVRLYIQPNTNLPLLIDSDGDDNHDKPCDTINNPPDKPLPFLKLAAVNPTVTASPVWSGSDVPAVPICRPGPASSGSPPLCGAPGKGISDMSVVIRHPVSAMPFEPVIYAVEPESSPSSDVCTGKRWDLAAAISKADGMPKLGWVCIAARAMDNVGNIGVSAPLRVCLADENHLDQCNNTPPPSCTDGCTAPPHFNPAGPVKHN
jgi:hypothetical protein